MIKKRNRYSAEFKDEVALAALRNDETMADLTKIGISLKAWGWGFSAIRRGRSWTWNSWD